MTAVTVLRAVSPGARAAKRFTPVGVEPYYAGYLFVPERHPVDGIRPLSALLTALERDPSRLVIRGEPADFTDLTRPRPRDATHYRPAPTNVLCIDLDGIESPDPWPLDDLPTVAHRARGLLGPTFANTTTHIQLSASARPNAPLRAHLWFWSDRPLSDQELRQWAKSAPIKIDKSLYTAVQPHYVAAPIFVDGVPDPIAPFPRSALVLGETNLLSFPLPEPATPLPKAYLQIIKKLGDGPGLEGGHTVTLPATWAYVHAGGVDDDAVIADIQARGAQVRWDKHAPDEVARLLSTDTLQALLTSARQKYLNSNAPLFTPTELDAFGDVWPHKLVLVLGAARYVFDPRAKEWIPFTASAARTAMQEHQSRFPIVWVEPNGRLKRLPDLEHDYGTALTGETVHDLCASAPIVEPDPSHPNGHRLRLPAARRRQIAPAFEPAVHRWLETLSRPDIVRIWLRDLVRFEVALFGLVLTGPRGSGKSGFASALSYAYWGTGYTDAASIFPPRRGYFQTLPWTHRMLECPLVCAPEGCPRVDASQLRTFLGDSQTTIRTKGIPDTVLHGFPRLLVCANPSNAGLVLEGDVEQDELDATAERLQHVTTGPHSAAAFDWPTFGPGGALARHAAHLALEPVPANRPRFGADPDPAFARALVFASDVAQAALTWLLFALASPGATKTLPKRLDDARHGLRLTAAEVHAEWHAYPAAPPRPSVRALRAAWRVIAPGDVVTRATIEEHCHATGAALPLAVARIGEQHLTAAQ